MAILTTNDFFKDSVAFDQFTLQVTNTWGVGKADLKNGILIGIAPTSKLIRIQNGYGIAQLFTNKETKAVIDSAIIPAFKEGNFYKGTKEGIIAIQEKLNERGL
jgi:uncharacterized protein